MVPDDTPAPAPAKAAIPAKATGRCVSERAGRPAGHDHRAVRAVLQAPTPSAPPRAGGIAGGCIASARAPHRARWPAQGASRLE